ncbi:class II glutamine amidotransferase [Phycicoccus flavus]|uniref:class II glutamine amidotransferase n=1 Tax=Phycicoccus flavus TaxID=2502783 RepID=UPI000FEBED2B|nr:class II glutamine amidotransferase [Phycicoccus flavus]NHA66482.1 class II glutamine amidotransferase [Phycicoccus flavus]
MCRWLAYAGDPVPLASLVADPENSLIHQSRRSRLGADEVNADGFGVGWYTEGDPRPARFRSIRPAWGDPNLPDLARAVRSPLFVAHVRAATGSPVEPTNCHPFADGRWLWAHNGEVRGIDRLRRDLALALDPRRYPHLRGSTDSELLFLLALTFGLEEDPVRAVARTVGLVEAVGADQGVEHPVMMTVAVTDGATLWAFRYSSEHDTRTLFHTADDDAVRGLHADPDAAPAGARVVVSEPLSDLPGEWVEYPESSVGVVGAGHDEIRDFAPEAP